jgi:SLT domain-containing protein
VSTEVVGRGLVEILPDFRKWGAQLATDMRTARAQLDGSAAGLRRSAATVGASMAKVGKATTLVGVGVAVASVKMAADFQSETAILQTAAGETTKGLAVVRTGIKNIAMGTGTGIKNLTDGMYTVEKAGYRGAEGLKVLEAAAQGAREEGAKLSDVTNAMTSIMASYHLKASDSVRVMNAMKTAAGEGKITMEEFSGALSTVLPIASANKISFEDIAGSMATLTQHGTSAREATHELGATIRAIAAPNMVAVREMGRFGLSATDVSTRLGERGLSGTANLFVETILHKLGPAGKGLMDAFEGTKQSAAAAQTMLKNMNGEQSALARKYLEGKMLAEDWKSTLKGIPVAQQPALRNFKTLVDRSRGFSRELKAGGPQTKTFTDALRKMSGGAIGLNTILQITGESAEGNAERISKVGESFHHNSKDVEGWKITAGLLNVQMDRLKAQAQVLAINIGTKLIPVVSRVTGYFVAHRTVLLYVVGALAAFMGIMTGAYVVMKIYATYTRLAAIATGSYNLAMRLGARYALGTRLQLAALFVQQKLAAAWTGIVTAAQWAWNAAMTANPIGLIIVGIGLLVAAVVLIATKTQWFQRLWGAVWGAVKAPVMAFVGWISSAWDTVWGGIKTGFNAFIGWFKANWQLITFTILTGGIGLAVAMIVRHWDAVKKGAEGVYHAVTGWFVRMGEDIAGFFSKLPGRVAGFFTAVWSAVAGFFTRLPGQLATFFTGLWSAVSGFFTALPGQIAGFFTGLWSAVYPHLAALPGQVGGVLAALPGQVGGFLSSVWSAVSGFFVALPGRIASTATGWATALYDSGKNLITGLWNGVTTFFTQTLPAFGKMLWSGIVDYFKAVFGIHSPSTVMAGLGMNLIQGLFGGILAVASGIAGFLDTWVVQPIKGFFTRTIPNAASWMAGQVIHFWQMELQGLSNIWGWIQRFILYPIGNFFTRTIPGWASWMAGQVVHFWQMELQGLSNIWGSIKRWVLYPIQNFFTRSIPGAASAMRSAVVGQWNGLVGGLMGVYGSIQAHVFSPIGRFFTTTIPGWARSMSDKVTGFFRSMSSGIGKIWNGVTSVVKTPINWVLDHVWNKGIWAVWDKITGWIGIKNSLGKIKMLASGGTVGNEPVGVFNRPTAIVGEGNPSYPEYVIPTDPKYATRARALWEAAGAHFYESGGILSTIGSAISSGAGKVVDFGKSAVDFLSDPVGHAKDLLLGPLKNLTSALGNSAWVKMITRLPRMAVDGLIKAVKSVGSSLLGLGGGGDSGGGGSIGAGVQQWAPVTRMVLSALGQPQTLLGITLKRMNQESGGNPNIVNTWDSNWQAGHPSVGLMQVIGPTFARYAGPYRNTGPFKYGVSVNPAANIYASGKYALAAYGSLASAYGRAGGYRLGTMGSSAGWHWVGEDGPELAKLPAGTRIRSASASARQAPATAAVVHLTVENHGVIGSAQQTEDWLAGALDQLRRKNRLPSAMGGR